MTDSHPLGDIPMCSPPRSWVLNDGSTIREGSRVRYAPTAERGHAMSAGATGTVESFAGPGWALVMGSRRPGANAPQRPR
jgi:hypothetical protein